MKQDFISEKQRKRFTKLCFNFLKRSYTRMKRSVVSVKQDFRKLKQRNRILKQSSTKLKQRDRKLKQSFVSVKQRKNFLSFDFTKIGLNSMFVRPIYLFFLLTSILFLSCSGGYSFTGASINPQTKTFHVETFLNRASIVQPILASELTYALINKIRSGTDLSEVENNADVSFSGVITSYSVTPSAISANDRAAKNRLTIRVKVTCRNMQDKKSDFETTFTRYKEYDSSLSLSDVEEELIKEINEELVDDIFTKAFVNW